MSAFQIKAAFHLVSKLGLPDYMHADSDTGADIGQLPDNSFADPVKRWGPLHTKQATYQTAVELYASDSRTARVEARLLKAAALHEISADVLEVQRRLVAQVKIASTESLPAFALVMDHGEQGGLRGYMPIDTAAAVQDSSRLLVKCATEERLPLEMVHEAAVAIVKAASAFEVDPSTLHAATFQFAGEMDVDYEKAAGLIESRALVIGEGEQMDVYRELVKEACVNDAARQECVTLLTELDEINGVRYGGAQLDPYRIIYSGGQTKEAFDRWVDTMFWLDDVMIPKGALSTMDADAVEMQFSAPTAERIKAAAEVVEREPHQATAILAELHQSERDALLALMIA